MLFLIKNSIFVPMIEQNITTKPFLRIVKKGQEADDIFYWLSQPPIERIRALEQIRKQYNDWKYGTGREFQRVYRIIKQKRG
ncbi:MAG: hypothetical protein RLZZ292_3157 [Bacteroidota bacterium]|jgi:hypothetical protein